MTMLTIFATIAALVGGEWTAAEGLPTVRDVGTVKTGDESVNVWLSDFKVTPLAEMRSRPDALVPVTHAVWRQTGDKQAVKAVWSEMEERVDALAANRGGGDFFGGCRWLLETRMILELGPVAGGRWAYYDKYRPMNIAATDYLKGTFLTADGKFRDRALAKDQMARVLALYLRLVEGTASNRMCGSLKKDLLAGGIRLRPFFRGDELLLETLSQFGMSEFALTLALREKRPTFRAWFWEYVVGIAADSRNAGYANVILMPGPDPRIGFVRAELQAACGVVKSEWTCGKDRTDWSCAVPNVASVTFPGSRASRLCDAGTHRFEFNQGEWREVLSK